MSVVVLLGAPGAGKGTQAPILAERLKVPHIATGDLFRAAVRAGTPIGIEARRYIDAGRLVPDEITVRLLSERLDREDTTGGAILDGFPRNRRQAEILDTTLADGGRKVDRALYIEVPTDELVRRMAGRRICQKNGHPYNVATNPPAKPGVCDLDGSPLIQRPDDEEDTVRSRMATQIPPLMEVVEHYRDAGTLAAVDGQAPIDDVTAALLDALGEGSGRTGVGAAGA